jgi:hypothetical protein
MLTTKQVRAIIKQHRPDGMWGVYTNKTAGDTTNRRKVKCYFRNDVDLFRALQKAAGRANVYLTPGSDYCHSIGPGIIVNCVL